MAIDLPRIMKASTASRITSVYGLSKGADRVERIAFGDKFDDPSHHVAIARQVNCFTRWFYTPIQARNQKGHEQTVYVNNNSFRKRFSHSIEELGVLGKFFPEYLEVVRKVKRCSPTIRTLNENISEEDIIKWVIEAERQASEYPKVISNKDSHLGRSLLSSPSGNYVLLTKTAKGDELAGEGRFKRAKYAVNLNTGEKRIVAVVRKTSSEQWEALRNEISYMKSLKGYEGVVQIDTAVITGNKCYIIMENCDKGDLRNAGRLTPEDKLRVARDCAIGVGNIHALKLIHRDLKMNNIFLYTGRDGLLHAKIGDLGTACPNYDRASLEEGLGTPGWTSPEKARLRLGGYRAADAIAAAPEADDVWALGLVYYNLFNPLGESLSCQLGRKEEPLRKTANLTQEALDQEINGSGIDPKYLPLIKWMLSINPQNRPRMWEVQQHLQSHPHIKNPRV